MEIWTVEHRRMNIQEMYLHLILGCILWLQGGAEPAWKCQKPNEKRILGTSNCVFKYLQ
jgi:hypothetical protein